MRDGKFLPLIGSVVREQLKKLDKDGEPRLRQ
jgi:hypothetical protein